MNTRFIHPAKLLVDTLLRIYQSGMTTTSGGNLSIRDENGCIWITPGGIDKGTLKPSDIVQVMPDGSCVGIHKPSSELPFHRSIYQLRPDARAVIHAHAPSLVAFSMTGQIPDTRLIPGAAEACGKIAFAKYEIPGSEKLGQVIAAEFAAGADSVIMENHGAVVCADSLLQAYHRFETLDLLGRIGIDLAGKPTAAAVPAAEPQLPVLPPQEPTARECELRRDIAAFVRRAARQGVITGDFAVISARLGDDDFLTTGESFDLAYFDEADVVRVKNGAADGKIPAAATAIRAIYQADPAVQSVFYAATPSLMSFAVSGRTFDSRTIPESYIMLRDVPRVDAAAFAADPAVVTRYLSASRPVLMVESGGLLTTGKSLTEAFDRLEVGDFTAHCLLLADRIGTFSPIAQPEVDELIEAFHLPKE